MFECIRTETYVPIFVLKLMFCIRTETYIPMHSYRNVCTEMYVPKCKYRKVRTECTY